METSDGGQAAATTAASSPLSLNLLVQGAWRSRGRWSCTGWSTTMVKADARGVGESHGSGALASGPSSGSPLWEGGVGLHCLDPKSDGVLHYLDPERGGRVVRCPEPDGTLVLDCGATHLLDSPATDVEDYQRMIENFQVWPNRET